MEKPKNGRHPLSDSGRRIKDNRPDPGNVVAALETTDSDVVARALPPTAEAPPFVAFMESLQADGLDLVRDRDTGRDVAL